MTLRELAVSHSAVDAALSALWETAVAAAEHAAGPCGRSRTADLRRLAAAVKRVRELAEDPQLHEVDLEISPPKARSALTG